MHLQLSLTPTSTGEVYKSTFDAFATQGIIPSTVLQLSHPFRDLWRDHLAELTSPGLYEPVIKSFVALAQGDPTWSETPEATPNAIASIQKEMQDLLRQHPPNVVVVRNLKSAYGCHIRRSSLWPFICISRKYVRKWAEAEEGSERKLGLNALLIASIDHELGHWVMSLKVGHYSDKFSAALTIEDGDQQREAFGQLSPQHRESNEVKITPKKIQASWKHGLRGEAGDFVEVCSRGGIIGYSGSQKAIMQTGPNDSDIHKLPISYLKVFLKDGPIPNPSLLYTPPAGLASPLKEKTTHLAEIFPTVDDDCPSPSGSGSAKPSLSLRQLRMRAYEILEELREEEHDV